MFSRRILARGLVLLALVTSGIAMSAGPSAAADISGAMPVLDGEEKAFVKLINDYRAANGRAPLQVSIALTKASAWMSDDMSKRSADTFGHADSLGRDPFARMATFGYDYSVFNTYAAENIAAGNAGAAETFTQWKNSPGHNANMLDANEKTMGIARVGRAGSPYKWYWTNDFGGFVDATVTEPVVQPPLSIPTVRSTMVALAPSRLFDTRSSNAVGPDQSMTVHVVGKNGIPAGGVSAVTMTVTLTDALAPGFVTVYPGGGGRPDNSNLNVEGSGSTVANLVTVPVGPSGDVVFYTSGGGHLIADVAGYYGVVNGTARAGRFRPTAPTRLLDTRSGGSVAANTSRTVHVVGQAGVPNGGVSAVSVNLTLTNADAAGFLTAYPAAGAVPNASNLNINHSGDTVAGAAVVPVDGNGNIAVYLSGGGDLIVDINGWFTDGSAPAASGGLFVAQSPRRQLDTRSGSTLGTKSTRDVGVPTGAIAVSANLTLTGTAGAGFLTAFGAGGSQPLVSSINSTHANHTVANHAIIPAAGAGVRFFADMRTDLLVDYDGYYLPDGV